MIVELCAGNIDIMDGLVNGSDGIFHGIDNADKPTILWVEFFQRKTGAEQRKKYHNLYTDLTPKMWTPVFMATKEFQVGKNSLNMVTRTQFPVQPANARTIHRAQGLTMPSLAFDPSKIKSHGLIYTALSRVSDPKNLYLLSHIKENQIKVDKNVLQEIKRLRTQARWQCINKDLSAYSKSHLIIQSLNIVSMQAHMQDLVQDTSIMASDILCFQETKQAITQHPIQSHFSSISCYVDVAYQFGIGL